MRRTTRPAAAIAAAAVLVATTPAVVAADSVTGQLIRRLNRQMLYLAVPIAILVEVILFYAVSRFRDGEAPVPTQENRELEITWTVATGLVLVFVGTASFAVLAHPLVASTPGTGHGQSGGGVQPGDAPADAVEVVVVAEQWEYTFRYPDTGVTSSETLVLPTDRPVYVYVTSRDVLHSMHVPELGLKQDIFPGQFKLLRTRLLEPGTHRLYCTQFCGRDHATMLATVRVVSPGAYADWLDRRGNASDDPSGNGTDDAGETPGNGTGDASVAGEVTVAGDTNAPDPTAARATGAP